MEKNTPDVTRALNKIAQAMDKLHSTRLFLQKDSPEWNNVLRAEVEVYKALTAIEKKVNPMCSSVAYVGPSPNSLPC
jgi:hypothetical protein